MSVTLRDIVLPLPDFALEVDIDLTARTTALCGPSGAGKTSLLELIAGLRRPERGTIRIGDRILFDAAGRVDMTPRLRRIGYVPQDDALFPHLSARGNMLYAMSSRAGERDPGGGRPASLTTGSLTHARDDMVGHVENVLEIGALGSRSVKQLSGGERKRVALARALLSQPQLLLLDEPLSGVHAELRGRVLQYLVRVRDEFSVPMIYVTHDIAEAASVCEEVVMIDRGRIVRRDILNQ